MTEDCVVEIYTYLQDFNTSLHSGMNTSGQGQSRRWVLNHFRA